MSSSTMATISRGGKRKHKAVEHSRDDRAAKRQLLQRIGNEMSVADMRKALDSQPPRGASGRWPQLRQG